MDVIATLPEEMLREILSLLPFNDLLHCTLVCWHWHNIAEPMIHRRGYIRIGVDMTGHGRTLWNSTRQYHTVVVDNPPGSRRSLVNLLMLPSTWIFKPSEIQLLNFLADSLDKFCRHGHRLLENAETVHIKLDDDRHMYLNDGAEEFVLKFPMMKHLVWSESLHGHGWKTVTIDAPLLQTVVVSDALDPTAVLKIPECDQLQHVKCSFRTKTFENVFTGYLSRLETLILDFHHHDYDLYMVRGMPCLKWLELSVELELPHSIIETILGCSKLEGLKLEVRNCHAPHGRINLNQVFDKLSELQQIELSGLSLSGCNPIEAQELRLLKMRNVKLPKADCELSFNAPTLHTLSTCEESLVKMNIDIGNRMKKLYVELKDTNWKEAFNVYLRPFLHLHVSIDELILMFPYSNNLITCDKSLFDQPALEVVRLELHHFEIRCDFTENVNNWHSLQRLSLVNCNVICCCPTTTSECGIFNSRNLPAIVIKTMRNHRKRREWTSLGRNHINPL
ncbi:uncharacterized protein LOC135705823 [Ochlerotatus camptorhynchus]|uniref:uncharacterized protein LOC135705823 n=1 Tax=Ochlerotatus camptorhynchus TaxID=644619 RepID=UPI0031D4ABBF